APPRHAAGAACAVSIGCAGVAGRVLWASWNRSRHTSCAGSCGLEEVVTPRVPRAACPPVCSARGFLPCGTGLRPVEAAQLRELCHKTTKPRAKGHRRTSRPWHPETGLEITCQPGAAAYAAMP